MNYSNNPKNPKKQEPVLIVMYNSKIKNKINKNLSSIQHWFSTIVVPSETGDRSIEKGLVRDHAFAHIAHIFPSGCKK